ncbi:MULTISPECIES: hypothetical protein [Methylobacter]
MFYAIFFEDGFCFIFKEVIIMSINVMTVDEINEVSGALSMSNGGNWGNTWTLTGIGAAAGAARGGGWPGAAVWGAAGFFGSFSYNWSTSGFSFNSCLWW